MDVLSIRERVGLVSLNCRSLTERGWSTAYKVIRPPPDNKPLPSEFANCFPYLIREFELLKQVRVLIGLWQVGFYASMKVLQTHAVELPRPRPRFGHNVGYRLGPYTVIGTFHPSRQNTNTGRLTAPMFDMVFEQARRELQR